jgi:hypothetical protein
VRYCWRVTDEAALSTVPRSRGIELRRGVRQLALGGFVLATMPVVGWFAFAYHVAVGLAVSLIYGSAATVVGASSIVRGAVTIRTELRVRRERRRLEALPAARLLRGNRRP